MLSRKYASNVETQEGGASAAPTML